MKILVGLGNPGLKYKNNRHNVGHMFVDYCIKKLRITDYGLKCVKTDTFMNSSGVFVKKLMRNSQFVIDQLFIAHDDLDIPFGKFKIQLGTGPKLHNGIGSIEHELGTNEFWRIRIGVDARPSASSGQFAPRIDGETYCLEDFTEDEHKQLQSIFENIYKQLTQ